MLKRCARCGKPVYAPASSAQVECSFCYAKTDVGNLASLSPVELDWRKPLYDAAVLMPAGETSLRRFSFLGNYGYAIQRIELCKKELALMGDSELSASLDQANISTEVSLRVSQPSPHRLENESRQHVAAQQSCTTPDALLLSACETNPFNILGATPRSTREELVMLQKDEALFGNGQVADEALAALAHPDSRLEAEMHWFPQTGPEEINQLLGYLKASQKAGSLLAFAPQMTSALAQFNAVRLVLSIAPIENALDFRSHILSLATLADALLADQVFDEINADHEQALFTSIQHSSHVEAHIEALLNEAVSHILSRKPRSMTRSETATLERHLSLSYRDRNSAFHNSYFLELASDMLAST